MNEWGVVTVIIALVGLFATVSKPIIKLNKTITELSTDLKQVMTRLDKLEHMKSRKIPPGNLTAVSMTGLTRMMN